MTSYLDRNPYDANNYWLMLAVIHKRHVDSVDNSKGSEGYFQAWLDCMINAHKSSRPTAHRSWYLQCAAMNRTLYFKNK